MFFIVEVNRADLSISAMKKQAESTNNEYDRMLKEHAKLQVTF